MRERERDEMKSWKISGALRAHMAEDMVNLDCLCGDSTIQRMTNTLAQSSVFLLPYISLYIQYCISVCIYCMCLFGFLGLLSLGMGWKTASRTGVE